MSSTRKFPRGVKNNYSNEEKLALGELVEKCKKYLENTPPPPPPPPPPPYLENFPTAPFIPISPSISNQRIGGKNPKFPSAGTLFYVV